MSGVQPSEAHPELDRVRQELARATRENAALKRRGTMLDEENGILRGELTKLAEREGRLQEEVKAYAEHTRQLQQAAEAQAEAEQAALTAELERELPESARPGEVTPRLGGDVNLPPRVPQAIVDRPAIIAPLDMQLVVAQRDMDAKAEREEAEVVAAHNVARADAVSAMGAGMDEDKLLAIEEAAAMMAAGKEVPEHLKAAVVAARERLREMGWDMDEDDDEDEEDADDDDDDDDDANPYFSHPRVLSAAEQEALPMQTRPPPASAAASTACSTACSTASGSVTAPTAAPAATATAAAAKHKGLGSVPPLQMGALTSGAKVPSYAAEFAEAEARNAAAGIPNATEASATVDKRLYGDQAPKVTEASAAA